MANLSLSDEGEQIDPDIVKQLESKFKTMMQALYTEGGSSFRIDIVKHPDIADFIKTHAKALDGAVIQVQMSDTMRRKLTHSNHVFSGMKTVIELGAAWPSIIDENGNQRTFEQFLSAVQTVDNTYNKNYLRAEYNFAKASAEMASKWEKFQQGGDRYLLQYRTASDDKVRPEHAALHNVTLPVSDSFWDEYYPPNGWNCRCNVVQVLKSMATPTPHSKAMELGEVAVGKNGNTFRFNAGKEGHSLADSHPYFPDQCKGCPYNTGRQTVKDCYSCQDLKEALNVARTEEGYSWELAKNVLEKEAKHRNDRVESAHIFNPKTGEHIKSALSGKKSSVDVSSLKSASKDAVMTHNHPGAVGKRGLAAIGNSFSPEDIITAVDFDVAEIRAVTPTYTFSMKRPKGGWGVKPSDVERAIIQINQRVRNTCRAYIGAADTSETAKERIERCNAIHYHLVMKQLSKLYGWDYSKKNS